MREDCIRAVTDAAGRALSQQEIKGIEERIAAAQRYMAQKYRKEYLSMSPDQRLRAAGLLAAKRLVSEAGKAHQRTALAITAHDRIANYIARQKAKYGMSSLDAFDRVLAFKADGKSDFQSVETRTNAVAFDAMRNLVSVFDSIGPKAFGLFANREGTRAFMHELFGQDSRKVVSAEVAAIAKQAAKAWGETGEAMRKAFNDAGGDIGQLEDWHLPQNHSQRLVAAAGRNVWVKTIFPLMKRDRYVNTDGTVMNDAQLVDLLNKAWETIATGGANKSEPGTFAGNGMLANAHAAERVLHFKDADSYLAYADKFGNVDIYTAMMEHIQRMARDTALIETLGPNPNAAARFWIEKSAKEAVEAAPTQKEKIDAKASAVKDLYDYISGRTKPVANRKLAEGFDTLRHWMVATKLGSSAIASLTDNATMHLTAAVNHMSSLQMMRNQLKALNLADKDELKMAQRAGLSLRTYMGEINRWGSTALGPSFSAKMANLTIRLSGLNAMTEGRRRAFGVTMYGALGDITRKASDLAGLHPQDRAMLERKGITETDFKVWKKAKLQDWGDGNSTMLTPEAVYAVPDEALLKMIATDKSEIPGLQDKDVLAATAGTMRREAALKLLGMVDEEVNMAVIEPGARDKVASTGGLQRGTWRGELARSVFLFKGFPMATIARHWTRGMAQGTAGGRAAYIASYLAGSTIMGAAAQQITELINGRDPRDMASPKFWVAAMLKGGSLGIYGDFLFSDTTQYGNTPLGIMAGPVASAIEDLTGLTQGSMVRLAKGEDTNFGRHMANFIKNNIPLQNLWYTKAVTDRLWAQNIMEMISPGYMARVEARARSQFGQSYWWHLNQALPSRPPEFQN